MPSVPFYSKILVTGSSGFLGAWVIRSLLDRGFVVRATVRSYDEAAYLCKDLFHEEARVGRLDWILVPDMCEPRAFDEAVKGVDGVVHVAANVEFTSGDPNVVIKPAVCGTIGILQSVFQHGLGVRRVVLTSSLAAVVDSSSNLAKTYNEEDWNDAAIERVRLHGSAASPLSKYAAAKTLAEQAAWDFMDKHRDRVDFDITVLCPSYIYGPFIHNVPSPRDLNTSLAQFLHMAMSPPEDENELLTTCRSAIDVRDCASAHVDALVEDVAGGERIIITAGSHSCQDILDGLNYPPAMEGVSLGQPDAIRPSIVKNKVSPEKARMLPTSFRPLNETFRDTLTPMIEKGWFKTFRTSPTPSPMSSPVMMRRPVFVGGSP